MKFVLLAATALAAAAVPAFAQDAMTPAPTQGQTTTPTDPATAPTTDQSTMGTPDATAPTAQNPAMPAPAQTTDTPPAPDGGMAPAQSSANPAMSNPGMANQSMPNSGSTMSAPAGGYQPSGPAIQGQAAPGAAVRFQPAQTPDQAYPAPAPLAKYPVCKKGQYDKCIQRGGK